MVKKYTYTLVMLSMLTVYPAAVTYDFSGGRLGDNLISFSHVLWASYKYEVPLLYRSFKYSDQLQLHKLHESCNFDDHQEIIRFGPYLLGPCSRHNDCSGVPQRWLEFEFHTWNTRRHNEGLRACGFYRFSYCLPLPKVPYQPFCMVKGCLFAQLVALAMVDQKPFSVLSYQAGTP